MSLQSIISSAVNIEINRSKLVAQSVSRSGRILTAARNWANPFRFTVEPKPLWKWTEFRDEIEAVMVADRLDTHTIYLAGKVGGLETDYQNWLTAYQGNLQIIFGQIRRGLITPSTDDPTIASFSGTTMVVNTPAAILGKQLVKVGDYICPGNQTSPAVSYRHPYIVSAVTNNGVINGSTLTITTHRPFIPVSGYSVANKTLFAGSQLAYNVKVVRLPNIRFVPGQFVEFNGVFELIEELPVI